MLWCVRIFILVYSSMLSYSLSPCFDTAIKSPDGRHHHHHHHHHHHLPPTMLFSGCEETEGAVPDFNGSVPSKVLALGDLHSLQVMERMNHFPQANLRKQKTSRPQVVPKENIPKRVSFRLPTCWSLKQKPFSQATDAAKIAQRPKRLRF